MIRSFHALSEAPADLNNAATMMFGLSVYPYTGFVNRIK